MAPGIRSPKYGYGEGRAIGATGELTPIETSQQRLHRPANSGWQHSAHAINELLVGSKRGVVQLFLVAGH